MTEYAATAASVLGGFAVDGRRAELLPGPIHLHVSDDESPRLELDTGYDPPGSGLYALGATIATAVVVAVLASGGPIAAPGWLVWYVIFTYARRRRRTLNLLESRIVRIDAATRRLAFESAIDGRATCVAIEVKEQFDEVSADVRTLMAGRVTEGRVGRGGVAAFVILAIVILAVGAVMLWASLS